MKAVGVLLIILGIICGYNALTMDVSVSAGLLGRVANADAMAQRQNFLIVSGLLFIAGVILFGVGALLNHESTEVSRESNVPLRVSTAHPADVVCASCGVILRLDPQELEAGQYNCPSCNTTSKLGAARVGPSKASGVEPESKECPMCAETIKFKAKICRFCNHSFETEARAAA